MVEVQDLSLSAMSEILRPYPRWRTSLMAFFSIWRLDERALEKAELMIGLPDRLELGKVLVRLLHKMREGIEFLQFLFVGVIEVGGDKS
ncbi:MAG TPA: hypothetical protein VKR06_26490 [Ktedonosporobacter sp.]|nr:hypothetical protein [Ktedonosporobacter sp.]